MNRIYNEWKRMRDEVSNLERFDIFVGFGAYYEYSGGLHSLQRFSTKDRVEEELGIPPILAFKSHRVIVDPSLKPYQVQFRRTR